MAAITAWQHILVSSPHDVCLLSQTILSRYPLLSGLRYRTYAGDEIYPLHKVTNITLHIHIMTWQQLAAWQHESTSESQVHMKSVCCLKLYGPDSPYFSSDNPSEGSEA